MFLVNSLYSIFIPLKSYFNRTARQLLEIKQQKFCVILHASNPTTRYVLAFCFDPQFLVSAPTPFSCQMSKKVKKFFRELVRNLFKNRKI